MNMVLRIGAPGLTLTAIGFFSMAGCEAGAQTEPDSSVDESVALVNDSAADDPAMATPVAESCGFNGGDCCDNYCCHEGTCVYRVFQSNVCRTEPASGSVLLECNTCNPIHAVGCGAALAACGAACATGAGVPECIACLGKFGAPACASCVGHIL